MDRIAWTEFVRGMSRLKRPFSECGPKLPAPIWVRKIRPMDGGLDVLLDVVLDVFHGSNRGHFGPQSAACVGPCHLQNRPPQAGPSPFRAEPLQPPQDDDCSIERDAHACPGQGLYHGSPTHTSRADLSVCISPQTLRCRPTPLLELRAQPRYERACHDASSLPLDNDTLSPIARRR